MDCIAVDGAALVQGRLAESAKRAEKVDFIVLDGAWESAPIAAVVTHIRGSGTWAKTPIVLLTTARVDASLGDVLLRNAVKQVGKPIRFSDLYECLAGALAPPTGASEHRQLPKAAAAALRPSSTRGPARRSSSSTTTRSTSSLPSRSSSSGV